VRRTSTPGTHGLHEATFGDAHHSGEQIASRARLQCRRSTGGPPLQNSHDQEASRAHKENASRRSAPAVACFIPQNRAWVLTAPHEAQRELKRALLDRIRPRNQGPFLRGSD
jgi:hypothetical protein